MIRRRSSTGSCEGRGTLPISGRDAIMQPRMGRRRAEPSYVSTIITFCSPVQTRVKTPPGDIVSGRADHPWSAVRPSRDARPYLMLAAAGRPRVGAWLRRAFLVHAFPIANRQYLSVACFGVHDESCPYLGPPCGGPTLSFAQRAISFRPRTVMPWLERTEAASSCASVRTTRP